MFHRVNIRKKCFHCAVSGRINKEENMFVKQKVYFYISVLFLALCLISSVAHAEVFWCMKLRSIDKTSSEYWEVHQRCDDEALKMLDNLDVILRTTPEHKRVLRTTDFNSKDAKLTVYTIGGMGESVPVHERNKIFNAFLKIWKMTKYGKAGYAKKISFVDRETFKEVATYRLEKTQ